MNIWRIDSSCTNYPYGTGGTDHSPYLQDGFDDALRAIIAGKLSMQHVLRKRPSKSSDPDGYATWIRIADSVAVMLGFPPIKDQTQSRTGQYFGQVFETYDRAVNALQASHNDPPKGYNKDLYDLEDPRPLVICGENTFTWIGLDDIVPHEGIKLSDLSGAAKQIQKGAIGAWYLYGRLMYSTTDHRPIVCGPMAKGSTQHFYNFIIICDNMFDADVVAQPSMTDLSNNPDLIEENTSLQLYTKQLGYLLVHEMMHWFGSCGKRSSGSWNPLAPKVIDPPGTDKSGRIEYGASDGKIEAVDRALSPTEMLQRGYQEILTYGRRYVWNLARRHSGVRRDNTGPKLAVRAADPLGYFAAAMFYSQWTWAEKGLAHIPGKSYN